MKKGNNIKSILGLTQEEVATLLGISRSQWSMYEVGQRDLPKAAKIKLVELLSCAKKVKSNSKTVAKIIATEKKETIQELEKSLHILTHQIQLVEQKITVATKIREQSFSALQFINELKHSDDFNDTNILSSMIQNRVDKQLKKYSEKYLTQLLLKKEALHYQHKSLTKKLKSFNNVAPNDFV